MPRLQRPSTVCSVLAPVVLALGAAAGCEPPAVPPASRGACTDCVGFDTIAALEFEAAPTLPSPGGTLIRTRDGNRWAFVDPRFRSEVLLFDGGGNFEGTVGRAGDGPGEFRGIVGILFDSTDSLWVFSQNGARVDVFGPDRELGRTMTLSTRMAFAAPLRGGRAVLVTFDGNGSGLMILDRDGGLQAVADAPTTGVQATRVALASDGDERYWVAGSKEYQVWEGRLGGSVVPLLDSVPDWYLEGFNRDVMAEFGGMIDTGGANILIMDHDADLDGVWVYTGVPSNTVSADEVRAALQSVDPAVQSELAALLADFVVQAVRPGSGEVIGSVRLDAFTFRSGSTFPYEVEDGTLMHVMRPAILPASGPGIPDLP